MMDPHPDVDPFPSRWDHDWIGKRQEKETDRLGYCGFGGERRRHLLPLHYRVLRRSLKVLGIYKRGHRNFLNVGRRVHHHYLKNWPAALSGYRILQIADTHIDLDPALPPRLCEAVEGIEAELVVFTGDYWEGTHSSFTRALSATEGLLAAIPPARDGCFGVLGNHDPCALGACLEERGIRILVNEARVIEAGGEAFALAGVDDAFYFRMSDLPAAARQCPDGLPRILLSHSPQVADEAAAAGFDFMLSGHTHGGQICWPNGWPLVTLEGVPREVFRGAWSCRNLLGYTSSGAGSSHVPVRYNCPPEVVLHHLHPAR